MNRKEFLLAGAAALGLKAFADEPSAAPKPAPKPTAGGCTLDDIRAAAEIIDSTTMFDAEKRAPALVTIQKCIDEFAPSAAQYQHFVNAGAKLEQSRVEKAHSLFPILWFYDHAAKKVLKEIRETKVEGDRPAIWYVYNMGIVCKTKDQAFSIDLAHRLGAEFAGHVDFALITHAHFDHYTQEFVQTLYRCKGHIVSNFLLDRYFYCNTDDTTREYGKLKIHITQGDHNKALKKAINCYEVTFGGENPFTIFHAGDLHRASQLRPLVKSPDVFMAHCQVGLDMTAAYQTTMPAKLMLPMHHQELGHLDPDPKQSGCVRFDGSPAKYIKAITDLGGRAALPVWGDRIV